MARHGRAVGRVPQVGCGAAWSWEIEIEIEIERERGVVVVIPYCCLATREQAELIRKMLLRS